MSTGKGQGRGKEGICSVCLVIDIPTYSKKLSTLQLTDIPWQKKPDENSRRNGYQSIRIIWLVDKLEASYFTELLDKAESRQLFPPTPC